MSLKRTKIIATLGPASNTPKVLKQLFNQGVNLLRLNFSHGDHTTHQKNIELIRKAAQEEQKIIGIIADLQGPKIRIARFKNKQITLKPKQTFILDPLHPDTEGTEEKVGLDYKNLPNDLSPGDTLLLDDGRIVLTVHAIKNQTIICHVKVGGILSNNKGINRLGGGLSADAITEKDKHDLKKAIEWGADYIAISFPRNAEDIQTARKLIEAEKGKAGIIAKIERCEAIEHIKEIIEASDAIMVARGDLAVEVGDAKVPALQKEIIYQSRAANRPVIIATQMMESMIENPVPTRAEVSDVANAVLDGTDAVMLSAETATGKYPDKVVTAMAKVCKTIETHPKTQTHGPLIHRKLLEIDAAIAMASIYIANHMSIAAIISLTETGATPLLMSRIRTGIPIYAFSRHLKTRQKVTLYRDVYPIAFDVTKIASNTLEKEAIAVLEKKGFIKKGDLIILTKGDYLGVHGRTNSMEILKAGEVLN
jgi:pyruvate kinase